MMLRLQKYLADAGTASRRKAEALIQAGRVSVNGRVVTELGTKIEPARDRVAVDGKTVTPDNAWVYIMLHKPEGVVTTVSDPQGRPVVTDLLPPMKARVFPVGRLDYDSSGLLLLTNDGALAQQLTHPRHAMAKTYTARLRGVPTKSEMQAFRSGLTIEGRRTAPCGFTLSRVIHQGDNTQALVTVVLREGRNRQIRKMCAAIGHPVLMLKRVGIGKVWLGDLPRGQWRYLTPEEVRGLKEPMLEGTGVTGKMEGFK